MTDDDYIHAAQEMERQGVKEGGGHFADHLNEAYLHLAKAYYHADLSNQRRLREEFALTFEKFHAAWEVRNNRMTR